METGSKNHNRRVGCQDKMKLQELYFAHVDFSGIIQVTYEQQKF